MNDLFIKRIREYFPEDHEAFLSSLQEELTKGFFLNTLKADRETILSVLDFPYEPSSLSEDSFYHSEENIGKTKAYELGLIYPQEIAASLSSSCLKGRKAHLILDLCAAPGGKTINALNRLSSYDLAIANDISHKRAQILSSNLERMGLDKTIVVSKKTEELASLLEGQCDVVLLDAPCSGEGMIRKYPEILETYSLSNIEELASIQKGLLEDAYTALKGEGILIYSTCTYAFEEDEDQILSFLERHPDMELIRQDFPFTHSKLEGTVKLCPLDHTEGQFFAVMKKQRTSDVRPLKLLKEETSKKIRNLLSEEIGIEGLHLYKHKDTYYLSEVPLPDLGNGILRQGIEAGTLKGDSFEFSHAFYRANTLKGRYRHVYELKEEEYRLYVGGQELPVKGDDGDYLIAYHGISLGQGRLRKGRMKNKYPKGLRRMI